MVLCKHSLICRTRTHHCAKILSVQSLFVLNVLYVLTNRRKRIAFSASKFRIVAMFVTVELRTVFHIRCVGMFMSSGQGQAVGTCECGNEPSDSIKCEEFLD